MRTRADEERLINPLIGPGSLIEPLGLLSIQMLRCFCVTFFVINSNFELIILRNDSVKRCGGETGGGVQDKALEFIPSFCCLRALFFLFLVNFLNQQIICYQSVSSNRGGEKV